MANIMTDKNDESPDRREMPAFRQCASEDESTDVEELSSQSNFSAKKEEEVFNHPNAVITSDEGEQETNCFDNNGYVEDEKVVTMCLVIGHTVSTFGQSVHHLTSIFLRIIDTTEEVLRRQIYPFEPEDLKYLNCFSDREMSIEEKVQSLHNLSLPEDQQWKDAESSAFISKKIQGIVQSFQFRVEKAKEKLVQPPTPSPSPPLEETSSDTGDSPAHRSRPRLQSLIEDEKSSSTDTWSQNVSFCCCILKRKFTPSFPKIIDPQSKLYIIWLFFVMASYAYNAWAIIFRAVFPYQTTDNLPIFLTFDYICDIIYVFDIAIFKVRLQFLHNGFWVENYSQTKANYFRKREFKLDIISLLPLDLLYFVYGINPLFRLPRFLKVQTFWEFFNRVDAVTKTPYVIRIIRTLMYMMYLIHLNACAYYAMSTWEGIGSNRWVFQGIGNAYIRCFYFATKTATSIGKNPKPENEIEYIFMTISWLMGVFIFAFLVGQIRDIVATATQSRTQYRQLMDQTVMYMRNLNLPDELQKRVRMWLNHNWEQQKTFNVGKILDTLPRKMKTDVAINVHYKTLVKVQLFKDCDKALLRDLVLQLKPVLFLPGDYICRKGEVGKEMYIVNKGIVEVIGGDESGLVLATLTKGSVFGEISLLGIPGCNRRTADVRSKGFSNLFVLSKDDLWEALKNYPEAQKVLKKKAKNIIKENEARAQATKERLGSSAHQETFRSEEETPYTPKLARTILQVLPKSYHRIQPHSSNSTRNSFVNIPSETDDVLKSTGGFSGNIPSCSKKTSFRNRKISISPPAQKPNLNLKPRSMSDGTLRKPKLSLANPEKSNKVNLDFPFIIKKISPTKSEPSSYHRLNSNEENRSGSFSAILNAQLEKRPGSKRHKQRQQSLVSESENICLQTVNQNDLPSESQTDSGDTSESSLISTQKINSDDDNTNSTNWMSSSSSIPYLRDLFNQYSQSLTSLSNSIHLPPKDESIEMEMSTNKLEKNLVDCTEDKVDESPSSSSSSSVLFLGELFHQSSGQSSNSSSRILPLSPITTCDVADHESSTNDSSSVYDNLTFVPSSIFSRRSSIFSDASE